MATINIRIDDNIKAKAGKTLSSLGLDMSSAVKLFLNQVMIENALPFRPTRDPKAIKLKWDKELEWTKKHGKTYKNAEEVLKDLM
ncbi:MAG: type II toxin-antitoxin system RelB/DinJ family antitoxin [Candidatus Paceibacterota bacterium]|jgi:DNA-damage-inducible protein J